MSLSLSFIFSFFPLHSIIFPLIFKIIKKQKKSEKSHHSLLHRSFLPFFLSIYFIIDFPFFVFSSIKNDFYYLNLTPLLLSI